MTDDLAIRILLAHLTGDYLLQSETMALEKTQNSWRGLGWCTLHCAIYTAVVALWLWRADLVLLLVIFNSHWFTDRFSLGSQWLKLVKGRSIMESFKVPQFREAYVSFACLVYAVVDNTFHLVVLWLVAYYL